MSSPGTGRARVLVAIPAHYRRRLFTQETWRRLADAADVIVSPDEGRLDAAQTLRSLRDTEILLTGWGTHAESPDWAESAPRLRALVHSAGSVRQLVDEAVLARGIQVSSQADQNGRPVAEYSLAMILLSAKRVFRVEREFRAGRVRYPMDGFAGGNFGARIGIVGASKVGRRVLRLLEPFDLRPQLFDPYVDDAEAASLGARKVGLDELFETSAVVSVHAPLLPSTERMIGSAQLALMPDGAVLINTARGALIDQGALIAELRTGRIDAVLDVTDPEVLPTDSPLWDLPNVFLTPHLAGSVGNEVPRLGAEAVAEVLRVAAGEPLRYPVSVQQLGISA
ncbi:MAG: hydroxyacid dehydrogenase [Microbacterium sp.]